MLTIIHGDNIEASRTELNRMKSGYKDREIRTLDGKTVTQTQLVQALESWSLYGSLPVVIIENLLVSLGKKSKSAEPVLKILTYNTSAEIILWESKEIGKTLIGMLGSPIAIKLCKFPSTIFAFLDGIKPGSTKNLLSLYDHVRQTEPAELIYTMMARRLRTLLMVKDSVMPEGTAPWQVQKLTTQASAFTKEQLLDIYRKSCEIEIDIKSGNSPFDMAKRLELLLVDI